MISKVLKAALVLQLASGVFCTLSLSMMDGRGGLEVVALFIMIFAIQAVCFLVAAWVHWRYSEQRRMARWILALPFVFWFLPGIVKILAGGRLSTAAVAVALLAVAAAIFVTCLLVPRKVASKLPSILFRSRVFNQDFTV